MYCTICILVLLFFSTLQLARGEQIVKTSTGQVRGIRLSVLGRELHAYLGIPYAIPPLGDLRFKKPLPITPWRGIYNATRTPPSCPQFSFKSNLDLVVQDNIKEDCLYLNMWVPNNPRKGKATIVWIHGGGFLQGSSSLDLYNGEILASQGNVIVASMNFRLGAFGFLNADTDEAPGNMGLHDQLLAIRWIKDNLENFGGSPSSITIAGQSSGAISACFHLLSPLSRGLANRVILESGSTYNSMVAFSPIITKIITSIFSARMGCNGSLRKPNKFVRCLRNKPAEEIYNEETKMANETFIAFFPRYGDDFLPYHPIDMMKDGNFQLADTLAGNTADEGSFFIALRNWTLFFRDEHQTTKANAEHYIRDLLRYNFDVPHDVVIKNYIEPIPDRDSASLLKATYQAIGASLYVCPSIFTSEAFSTNSNVFYYYYTHRSSQTSHIFRPWMGVNHLQEIPFVFGHPLRKNSKYLKEEIEFSVDVIEAWSSFAKNGVPHYRPLSQEWPKFSVRNNSYVELNPHRVTVGNNLRKNECDFWRQFVL